MKILVIRIRKDYFQTIVETIDLKHRAQSQWKCSSLWLSRKDGGRFLLSFVLPRIQWRRITWSLSTSGGMPKKGGLMVFLIQEALSGGKHFKSIKQLCVMRPMLSPDGLRVSPSVFSWPSCISVLKNTVLSHCGIASWSRTECEHRPMQLSI